MHCANQDDWVDSTKTSLNLTRELEYASPQVTNARLLYLQGTRILKRRMTLDSGTKVQCLWD